MFGKYVYRLMKYGIIAAIALVVGSTLLATVGDYVILLRGGNYTPLIGLVVISTILVYYSERSDPEKKLMKILLGVFAGLVSLLLFMVIFLWTYFIFGIIPAVLATFASLLYLNLIRDPNLVRAYWEHLLTTSSNISSLTKSDGVRISYRTVRDLSVYTISKDEFVRVVELFRSRPQLPMALSRYEDIDVLYVRHQDQRESNDAVLRLIGLEEVKKVSQLLSRVIISLPILEENYGINLADYVLVEDQSVVERILENPPARMTVIPHLDGPRLIMLNKDAIGMNVNEIPAEHRTRAIVGKDIRFIKGSNKEEVPTIAS